MTVAIRRLTEDDAAAYRDIRLEALRECPEAFGDDFEDASRREAAYWTKSLSGERAFFGAFAGGNLIGVANFMREAPRKMAHRGLLLGMYVRPVGRGTGCAMALVEAVLDHARDQVIQVDLHVGVANGRARRLYEKAGFEVVGSLPRFLKVDGEFIDEHVMVRYLDENG